MRLFVDILRRGQTGKQERGKNFLVSFGNWLL